MIIAARTIEHRVATLVGQRVFGIALGYEDINDHDELRRDPVMAVLVRATRAPAPDRGRAAVGDHPHQRRVPNCCGFGEPGGARDHRIMGVKIPGGGSSPPIDGGGAVGGGGGGAAAVVAACASSAAAVSKRISAPRRRADISFQGLARFRSLSP